MNAGTSTTRTTATTHIAATTTAALAPPRIHMPSGLAEHELRHVNGVLNNWAEEDLADREDTRHAVMTAILAGEKEVRVVFAGTVPTFPQYRIHVTVNDSRWTPTALSGVIPHALMVQAADAQAHGIEQMASPGDTAAAAKQMLHAINSNPLLSANAQSLMTAEVILASTRVASKITPEEEEALASALQDAVDLLNVMRTATPGEASRRQELVQALLFEEQELQFKRDDLHG